MNRRRFLAQMAGAGLAAPLVISEHVAAQTGPAPPSNVRLVSTPPPASTGTSTRQLLGGWRLAFSGEPQGAIAIDFSQMNLYLASPGGVYVFNLPAMNTGGVNTWPRLSSASTIAGWWPATQAGAANFYPNGLVLWKNKLWVAPRAFYATDPAATIPLTIYAQDGEKMTFPSLTQQKFSGFVKRGPGLDPMLGCGGYESGQGSISGPSLATMSGQRLIEYQWPGSPGSNLENWNLRAPRDTNYRPSDHGIVQDYWVAWKPRDTNGDGVLEGRWASDALFGGGLVLPEGITYWAFQGVGDLDYAFQIPTFGKMTQVSEYRYDANTYQFNSYALFQDVGRFPVKGQELGPDGKVYLSVINPWWDTGQNMFDVAIKVYG